MRHRERKKRSTKNWQEWKPRPKPPDYVDPPEVLERQQLYLNRWKAQGKIINQPRIAWSLACARHWYNHQERCTPEWGIEMQRLRIRKWRVKGGRTRVAMPDWKEHCDRNREKAHRLNRDRNARRRNPLAIPTQPKKVGRRLPI